MARIDRPFCLTFLPKDNPTTRRDILSVTSSVLGFLAPAILPAKKLLQDLCKLKLGWDNAIGEEELTKWKRWLSDLPDLSKIRVERCIKPSDFGEIKHAQLHYFADASQISYGAVSYIRLVSIDGRIHCVFLMG